MLRMLLKNWKLNSIAVFSLAIALSLGVTALSISNAILLRPPVARDASRLVLIFTAAHPGDADQVSYPEFQYFRDHARSFAAIAGYNAGVSKGTVRFQSREEMPIENAVTDNYFEVMGIHPFLGHFYAPGDDARRTESVVLTYTCWTRWGADPKIVGQAVKVGDQSLTIIGVAPKEFLSPMFGFGSDLILNSAASTPREELENRDSRRYMLIGRLRPDTGISQARAEIQSLWRQLATAYPKADKDRTVQLAPISVLSPDDIQTARLVSAVLIACSLLVLLIACANTANLLLARATLRRQEALIKTALGAPRRRLIGEFLRETAVVCAAGGLLGYGLASYALEKLSHFNLNLPDAGLIPISVDLHPGWFVILLTLLLIALASLASGLAPAFYASKPNLAAALTGEIAIGGTHRGWIRGIVVTVQVAVCTLVLAGAGLCWRSLHNLRRVDPGFSARQVATILVFPKSDNFGEEQSLQWLDDMRCAVARIPGIESASFADGLPLNGSNGCRDDVHFTDRADDPTKRNIIDCSVVDENYFSTLGIRLLEGRALRPSDRQGSPFVVVVNRFLAEKYWPHQSPIGRTFQIARSNGSPSPATVIGVVADGKYDGLDDPPRPFLYHALNQDYRAVATLIARTSGDPRRSFQPIMSTLRRLGAALYLPPTTMDSWINMALFVPLLTLACVGGISILAMLLATAGLYGAISYSVSDRRRELGIRIALGARPSQVMSMIFRQTLKTVGAGVIAGLGLSVVAAILLAGQFYKVHALEWTVLVSVGVGMLAVCVLIAYLAARRWTRMNPMDAVRHA